VSLPSTDQGLSAGLTASGKDYVYFWIRYDRKETNSKAPTVKSIQTTGLEVPKDPPIKAGDTIPVEAGGLGALYRVTDPSNVNILVQAEEDGVPRGSVAPHLNVTQARVENAGTFIAGGALVGEIRAIAFGGESNAARIANLRKQGWLECKGQALGIYDYPELYDVLRETWGTPTPGAQLVFYAPNLTGVFLRGWNHGTKIPTPNDGVNSNPSAPGDPDFQKRVATQVNGAKGDEVGSFQDAHIQEFPHTISGQPKEAVDLVTDNKGADNVASNPTSYGFDTLKTNLNAEGHDIAPKNVYVMYVIFAGRPILDKTP